MHRSPPHRSAARIAVACALWASAIAASAQEPKPAVEDEILTASGIYRIDYRTDPAPVPINEPFALDVIVRERYKSSPARLVDLEVDADMPAHNHGMFTAPKVTAVDPGRFRVTGMLFHMPGEWTIRFVVRRGLLHEKAEADVEVY
jgi:hypothetical protein